MDVGPQLPIHISAVGGKYLIFDIQAVTWLRRHHQLCGAFVGTLPQNPAQNVFLGLPVQIMPEEAQLLVETKVGHIVNDRDVHDSAMRTADAARKADYLANLKHDSEQISSAKAKEKERERQQRMKKVGNSKKQQKPAKDQLVRDNNNSGQDQEQQQSATQDLENDEEDTSLFDSTSTVKASTSSSLNKTTSKGLSTDYSITPTTTAADFLFPPTPPKTPTATAIIKSSSSDDAVTIVGLPSSYPLYRHLHNRGYYMTPGLRFGCQYSVYPGDPLRFHSHFLAIGVTWDEEIDLMDIVAGGRLGTGVKKGFLMGGEKPNLPSSDTTDDDDDEHREEKQQGRPMITYSIEWAGM